MHVIVQEAENLPLPRVPFPEHISEIPESKYQESTG
jgi:hypothetical protein